MFCCMQARREVKDRTSHNLFKEGCISRITDQMITIMLLSECRKLDSNQWPTTYQIVALTRLSYFCKIGLQFSFGTDLPSVRFYGLLCEVHIIISSPYNFFKDESGPEHLRADNLIRTDNP